ncbi:hypothetical protein F7725_020113 [Dissostichus mawsoni]|uniref:Uncharacterized protein n=1 Tax=Dissostichus mawsoni TaxID=36200 RepID=A0A7J5YCE1_DISMA|nr:hypothetical protein F7725_020113 [Dissostichus mawsoni]
MEGWMVGWMEGCWDGGMEGDGWMEGWMDGGMLGWSPSMVDFDHYVFEPSEAPGEDSVSGQAGKARSPLLPVSVPTAPDLQEEGGADPQRTQLPT